MYIDKFLQDSLRRHSFMKKVSYKKGIFQLDDTDYLYNDFSEMQNRPNKTEPLPAPTIYGCALPNYISNLKTNSQAIGPHFQPQKQQVKPTIVKCPEPLPATSSNDSIDSPLVIPASTMPNFSATMKQVQQQLAFLAKPKLNIEGFAYFIPQSVPIEQREGGVSAYVSGHPLKALALGYFDKLDMKSSKFSELRSRVIKKTIDWTSQASFFGTFGGLVKENPDAVRTLFLDFLDMLQKQTTAEIFGKYQFVEVVVTAVLLDFLIEKAIATPNYKTEEVEFSVAEKYIQGLKEPLGLAIKVVGNTIYVGVSDKWFRIELINGKYYTFQESLSSKQIEHKTKTAHSNINQSLHDTPPKNPQLSVVGKSYKRSP